MQSLPINIIRLLDLITLLTPLVTAYPQPNSANIASPNINVASIDHIGNITSLSTTLVRDLGWSGRIGNTVINSYGDTLYCSDSNDNTCLLFASNTAAISTADPTKVQDFNATGPNHTPSQFCAFNPIWGESPPGDWGMGISNVVQTTSDDTGILFFGRAHRPNGTNTTVTGAGVASVSTAFLYPVCERLSEQWWDAATEPAYGNHGAVDGRDGYIYAFGEFSGLLQQIMLARVPKDKATELPAFEYWNGTGFFPQRLQNPGREAVVLPDTNQGSVFWFDAWGCWVSLTRQVHDLAALTVRTSFWLSGPWSAERVIWRGPGYLYAPVWHDEFGGGDKEMWISYTLNPNIQQMVRLNLA